MIKVTNESALGIYVMAWRDGPDQRRCKLSWYPGLPAPVFEFWVTIRDRWSPPIPLSAGQLERFGWAEPRGANVKPMRTFAQRYAEWMHQAFEDEVAPAEEGTP